MRKVFSLLALAAVMAMGSAASAEAHQRHHGWHHRHHHHHHARCCHRLYAQDCIFTTGLAPYYDIEEDQHIDEPPYLGFVTGWEGGGEYYAHDADHHRSHARHHHHRCHHRRHH